MPLSILKSRRQFLEVSAASVLTLASAAAFLGQGAAMAAETPTVQVIELMAQGLLPDVPMGNEKAVCTVVEYASMTCTHCSAFHAETFPTLKTDYIDTGKVRFIMREFPLDPLAAVAFMLARYAGPEKRNAVVDLLFSTQKTWAYGDNPIDALKALMKQTGLTEAAFDACLNDKDLYAKVNQFRDDAQKRFGVAATPTFFINGTRKGGGFGVDELRKLVDPIIAKG